MTRLALRCLMLVLTLTVLLLACTRQATAEAFYAYSMAQARARTVQGGRSDDTVGTLGGLNVFAGMVRDDTSGDLILIGQRVPGQPAVTLDDLVVALRTLLVHQTSPLVSIDPTAETPQTGLQTVHFEGGIANTQYGADLLEADILLKKIALHLVSAGVPRVQPYLLPAAAQRAQRLADDGLTIGSRFWFKLSKESALVEREGVFAMRTLQLMVDSVQRQPYRDQQGRASFVEVVGGIELKATLLSLKAGDVTALRRAVLTSRPDPEALMWPVPIDEWRIPWASAFLPAQTAPAARPAHDKPGFYLTARSGLVSSGKALGLLLPPPPPLSTLPEFSVTSRLAPPLPPAGLGRLDTQAALVGLNPNVTLEHQVAARLRVQSGLPVNVLVGGVNMRQLETQSAASKHLGPGALGIPGVNPAQHLVQVLDKLHVPYAVHAERFDPVRIVTPPNRDLGSQMAAQQPWVKQPLFGGHMAAGVEKIVVGIGAGAGLDHLHTLPSVTPRMASPLTPSHVGGIYLRGASAALQALGPLKGVVLEAHTGRLVLVSEEHGDIGLPPLQLDDVVTIFRSVYDYGEAPFVSIDPHPQEPQGPLMLVRHAQPQH